MECTGLCILNGLRYDISCALKLIQAVPIMQAIQKSFVTYKAIKTRPVPAGEIQYENVAKRVVSPAFAISPTPASPTPGAQSTTDELEAVNGTYDVTVCSLLVILIPFSR